MVARSELEAALRRVEARRILIERMLLDGLEIRAGTASLASAAVHTDHWPRLGVAHDGTGTSNPAPFSFAFAHRSQTDGE